MRPAVDFRIAMPGANEMNGMACLLQAYDRFCEGGCGRRPIARVDAGSGAGVGKPPMKEPAGRSCPESATPSMEIWQGRRVGLDACDGLGSDRSCPQQAVAARIEAREQAWTQPSEIFLDRERPQFAKRHRGQSGTSPDREQLCGQGNARSSRRVDPDGDGADDRSRGVAPRLKVSMMIMRPPQQGHGWASPSGISGSTSV
jgi:hypothetical protein